MKMFTCLRYFISAMLFLSTCVYAAQHNHDSASSAKQINAKITELSDSTGLVYIGAEIAASDVSVYLQQLRTILGEQQFKQYRANQIARDPQGFHVTLINPFEYKKLLKTLTVKQGKVAIGEIIALTLQGLGKVAINANAKDSAESYFVIISSADGEKYRQRYALKAKDFHATLGFNPHDIYSKSKGLERLVK